MATGYHQGLNSYRVFVNGLLSDASGPSPSLSATADPFYVGRYDNSPGQMSYLVFFWSRKDERLLRNMYEGTRRIFGR